MSGGGRFDPGYPFRSADFRSQPDRWKQAYGSTAPAETAGAQALSRIVLPLRDEASGDGRRSCARGDWCAGYEIVTEDGTSKRRPARSYQPFCPKDRRLLETDLSQIPAQFVHVAAEIGNPVKNGQMIRMPFGPRMPIRLDIDTLMRAITESLSSWHERVADVDHLSYPYTRVSRFQRQMVAVRDAERVLIHRVDIMLALDRQPMDRTRRVITERDPKGRATEDVAETEYLDGADAGMEIFTLRYLCRAVLGETRAKPEELLGVPCRREECDKPALRRAELPSDPAAQVWWSECAVCGDRLTEDEYRDWTVRYSRWAQGRTVPTLENLPGVA
jgi:hypothetical protein